MDTNVGVPPVIKTSRAYKQELRQDILAMAHHFGTPEVFGTWTVNQLSPGFTGTLGRQLHRAMDDVPLFCKAYRREWDHIWKFIHGNWADRALGSLHASAWVTEYQDRGAPHVHYILWTKRSIDELIQQNNNADMHDRIVLCARNPPDPTLRNLVE